MKINKFHASWIMLKLISIAFSTAIQAIYFALRSKNLRSRIDSLAYRWSRAMLNAVKARYKIFNPQHVALEPHTKYIIMSNHCSHFDIPLIYMAFPHISIRMIAKKELFKIPLWGLAMHKAEFIMVDRGNREQATKVLQQARQQMAGGIVPWVAPEGTRSPTGKLQPFKKGGFILALETKAIIIPVGIRNSRNILPTKTLNFGIHEKAEVHIGAPIATTNYSIKNIRQLMQQVETSIRHATGEDEENGAVPYERKHLSA